VRGISDGAFNGRVQATVGVYFNDTPINFNAPYPEIPLLDIDSIEVLRGPQGSLYGTGSIGGIYHISTKNPNLIKPMAWVETDLSLTKDGGVNAGVMGMVNRPIVDGKFGMRAVGYLIENSGYIDDIRLGKTDINSTTIRGGRINGLWQMTPDWKLNFGAAYHDVNTHDTQYSVGGLGPLQRDNYLREPHHDDLIHLHFNVEGNKQWGKIKSTTSWINRNISDQFDASRSLPTNFNRPIEPTRYLETRDINFFSHETTVNIDVSDKIDVLLGGFITHANIDFGSDYRVLKPDTATAEEILYNEFRNDTSTHYGVFGELDIVATDTLELSAGVRWFDEHLNTKTNILELAQPEFSIKGEKKDSDVLPRLNIGYQFTPDAYLYALATVGYRVGGLNTGNAVNSFASSGRNAVRDILKPDFDEENKEKDNLSVFQSDVITMYELGGKTSWMDDKLIVNASIFYVDWKNIQTEHILNDGFSSVLNAGDATNLGYDFEVLYRPSPSFELQGNLTVNDPDFTNINPALGANIDGKHLPRIPDYSGGVVLTYRTPISDNWTSSWSVDYAYTGRSQLSFAPADDLSMGDNHHLNARANFSNDAWQVEVFVNNILNDSSNTFAFGNPFTFRWQNHITPQRPRTIGARVRRQF
ncbi:MAG TPA: TonB-dependent receptor, partial [Hellea balneolensis]|nr:TonB-dependent receptor [Hellea balneolensis]